MLLSCLSMGLLLANFVIMVLFIAICSPKIATRQTLGSFKVVISLGAKSCFFIDELYFSLCHLFMHLSHFCDLLLQQVFFCQCPFQIFKNLFLLRLSLQVLHHHLVLLFKRHLLLLNCSDFLCHRNLSLLDHLVFFCSNSFEFLL